jgi:HK97 family phage portal protein
VSFLRRAFEQRDLVTLSEPTMAAMGLTVPSNAEQAPTASGVGVTENTALGLTAFYACVNLLADSIASLPWDSYRKLDGRRIEVDPQPSLLRQPSAEMTAFDWKHMAMVSLLIRGNFYGLITQRDALGYPTSIEPLHPDNVRIDRDPKTFLRRVWIGDHYEPFGNLFHIPAFRLPGMDIGLSPIQFARHSLGLGLAAQEYGAKWFRDGAAPSSVLETEQSLTDDQVRQVQRSWVQSHGGRRRPAVLSGGFTWKPITITPEESQFLQTRQQQDLEACKLMRVPPHMVSIVDKSTSWGTGIEQQSIGFVTYTLRAWLTRLEDYISASLPRGQFMKFNVDGLLRGDIKSRYEAYRVGIDGGWMNPDEVRALEDSPPIPGGAGAKYRQPLNFGPLGAEPAPPAPSSPPAAPTEEAGSDGTN